MRPRYTEFGALSLDLTPSTACKVSCSATAGRGPQPRIHFGREPTAQGANDDAAQGWLPKTLAPLYGSERLMVPHWVVGRPAPVPGELRSGCA